MRSREQDQLLTRGELALIVLSVLPIFLFLSGPIWDHPFQIDASVYWSYAPIPVLVAGVLLRRRVFSFVGFLVNTITAVSVKYMITTSVAFLLWAVVEPPVLARAPLEVSSHAVRESDEARARREPMHELLLDSRAIEPTTLEVASGDVLAFRSVDGSLHTLRAKREDGRIEFNLPVVPGGPAHTVTLHGASALELSCAVHPSEAHAILRFRP